jgi:hypothetical protein
MLWEFVAVRNERMKELTEMQKPELFELLQGANRSWLNRRQKEASLLSEFSAKLTGAHPSQRG